MFKFAPPPLVRAAFLMLLGSAITGSIPPGMAQSTSAVPSVAATGPVPLTAEQIKAARSLTPEQIADLKVRLQPILAALKARIALSEQARQGMPSLQAIDTGLVTADSKSLMSPPRSPGFAFTDHSGRTIRPQLSFPSSLEAAAAAENQPASPVPVVVPIPPPCALDIGSEQTNCGPVHCIGANCPVPGQPSGPPPNVDADHDGLPDALEAQLADNFTPVYYISGGEQQSFATFADYVPMTVTSLLGPNTPFSYYRVTPLGVGPDKYGNQRSFLRIDYLTLWNADGGLAGGSPACELSFVGLDQVIGELTGHELDVERSGMYVTAPPVNGGLNPDPNAYSIAFLYTAAHEGTFFDASSFANYQPDVVPAGSHTLLALSLSKHSTYGSDPNYYNLVPLPYIAAYNAALTAAWVAGEIPDDYYYYAQAIANDAFFGCIVEQFHDQGGSIAQQRVNVGEVAQPINGGTFIRDDSARALNFTEKLTNPLPFY